jgi:hypothetical protein
MFRHFTLSFLFFCINPIISVVFSLASIYKGNERIYTVFFLSLALSLIFMYQPLLYDPSSNFFETAYGIYNNGENLNLYNYIPFLSKQLFGANYISVLFLYVFFINFIWFSFYLFVIKVRCDKKIIIVTFFFFIASLIYRQQVDLNRTYLSYSILLSFFVLCNLVRVPGLSKILLFAVIGFVALMIHSSVLILIVLFLLARFIPIRLFSLLYIVSLLASILLQNMDFMSDLFNSLEFINDPSHYFEEGTRWGSGNLTLTIIFQRVIEFFIITIAFFCGFFHIYKNENIDRTLLNTIKFTLLLICISICFISFRTMYERLSLAAFLWLPFLFIQIKKNRHFYMIQVLLLLMLVRFIFINVVMYSYIYTERYNIVLPKHEQKIDLAVKPIFYPSLFLLNFEYFGYSDDYIYSNSLRR